MWHTTRLKPKSAIEIYFDALQLNYLNRRIQLETVTWFLRANPRQQKKKKGDSRRVSKAGDGVASWKLKKKCTLNLRWRWGRVQAAGAAQTTSRRSFEEASIETSGTLFFSPFPSFFTFLYPLQMIKNGYYTIVYMYVTGIGRLLRPYKICELLLILTGKSTSSYSFKYLLI